MLVISLLLTAAAAITSAAPSSLESRMTKKTDSRLTQWANNVCGEGQHHIYEDKTPTAAAGLGCKSIDAQTHSFDFALGISEHVIAFTDTGCNDRIGVIFDVPGHAVNGDGDCVDADAYLGMMLGTSFAGKRINSVKFE